MSDRERETGEREVEAENESRELDADGRDEPDVEGHSFKMLEPDA